MPLPYAGIMKVLIKEQLHCPSFGVNADDGTVVSVSAMFFVIFAANAKKLPHRT